MSKTRKRLTWICLVAAVVLLVCGTLFVFSQKKGKDLPAAETASEPERMDISVETPYCTLHYPGKWQDSIQYEVKQAEEVTVSFACTSSDNQKYSLFDVVFNHKPNEAVGMISMEDGSEIHVHIFTYELDSDGLQSESEIYDFYAMQEDLNYLIAKLPLTESGADTEAGLPFAGLEDSSEDAFVETPYGRLVYPGELQSVMHVECTEAEQYVASFWWQKNSRERIRLFEICFGKSEEQAYGVLKDSGVPVYVKIFDVDPLQELNQSDLDMALRLQETVNDILANLALQINTAEHNTAQIPTAPVQTSDELVIDTPYGILRYPGNQKNIKVDVTQEDGYILRFQYIRATGEIYGLFDIVFDGTGDFLVGHSVMADGRRVEVHMNSNVIDLDDSWDEAEKAEYYSLAEGANDIFETYEAEYAFSFAG